MTDLEFDADSPAMIDPDTSTPISRAAGRLQRALPPGWRVEVVDPQTRPDHDPALRVVMPDD